MCGRYALYSNIEQIKSQFPIDRGESEDSPNYNVAPTQEVLAVIHQEGLNILGKLHWGLVPFWAKETKIGSKMINARQETVAAKPAFREAFKKRRCLIPADGFYEWYGEKGEKQPVFITMPDKRPFAFAGLWESWQDKAGPGTVYRSCTIITREAAGTLEKIHHRIPVVLAPEAYTAWMEPGKNGVESLQELLSWGSVTDFTFYPVSKQVNAVRNNGPENIEPVEANHIQRESRYLATTRSGHAES